MKTGLRSFFLLVCGALIGGFLVLRFPVHAQAPAAAQSDTQNATMDDAASNAGVPRVPFFGRHRA